MARTRSDSSNGFWSTTASGSSARIVEISPLMKTCGTNPVRSISATAATPLPSPNRASTIIRSGLDRTAAATAPASVASIAQTSWPIPAKCRPIAWRLWRHHPRRGRGVFSLGSPPAPPRSPRPRYDVQFRAARLAWPMWNADRNRALSHELFRSVTAVLRPGLAAPECLFGRSKDGARMFLDVCPRRLHGRSPNFSNREADPT